ncbi:hypothetical protein LVJ94_33765 [Pendulispora rubella]|uniref:Uncharacterized protein n=1 Tax=Pendulispora rubella TaxID=2741070 RepID=A0ABZ2KVT6_9BACT
MEYEIAGNSDLALRLLMVIVMDDMRKLFVCTTLLMILLLARRSSPALDFSSEYELPIQVAQEASK